jgi:hypothetical protein
MLLIALAVATAVERVARAPVVGIRTDNALTDDISRFSRALAPDLLTRPVGPVPSSDPFDGPQVGSAGGAALPAVAIAPQGPQLTAILIAEDGSVAVIDDDAVSVGSTLKSGERVARIQADRVWVVKPNGQWRMLSMPTRGR